MYLGTWFGWSSELALAEAELETGQPAAAQRRLEALADAGCEAPEVLSRLASLYEPAGRFDAALALWRRVHVTVPTHVGVRCALGRLLAQLDRCDEALVHVDAALALDPQHPEALYYRGLVLRLLHRREEAIESLRAVLPLDPDFARLALLEIARQQTELHDHEGARISLQQWAMVAPGTLEPISQRLFTEHHAWPPDAAGHAALSRRLGAQIAPLLPTFDAPTRARRRATGGRLRIGLVSADLHPHPVGYFLDTLLRAPASRDLEWIAYSNRLPDANSKTPLAQRLRESVNGWHEVASWTDAQLAQQIRDDGIDVLVDLSGHTKGHRLAAFASRPAPVQVSWLGYFNTTGLPFIDAIIADPRCVPIAESGLFTETVLRLPQTRFAYSPPQDAPAVASAPWGERGHVTFGCFQHPVKLGDAVLATWARIAAAVPGARWYLQADGLGPDEPDARRLRARMAAAGLDASRVDLRGATSHTDYLAAYSQVDLVLDTFPYPGGTTTAEALWMGVPTLTLALPGMLGRQGEQILGASGLDEWIVRTVDEYVARATAVAQPEHLRQLAAARPDFRAALIGTPFFDGERFGRDWVDAVRGFWESRTAAASRHP